MSRRRAVAVLVAGVAFAVALAVLALPDSGRLEPSPHRLRPPVAMTGLERAAVHDRHYARLTIGGEPGPSMTIVRQDGVWCVRD